MNEEVGFILFCSPDRPLTHVSKLFKKVESYVGVTMPKLNSVISVCQLSVKHLNVNSLVPLPETPCFSKSPRQTTSCNKLTNVRPSWWPYEWGTYLMNVLTVLCLKALVPVWFFSLKTKHLVNLVNLMKTNSLMKA